jgi:hypothetical protein
MHAHDVGRVERLYSLLDPLYRLSKVRQSKAAVDLLCVLAPFWVCGTEGFHVFIPEETEPTSQTLHAFTVMRIWFQKTADLSGAIGQNNDLCGAHACALYREL